MFRIFTRVFQIYVECRFCGDNHTEPLDFEPVI